MSRVCWYLVIRTRNIFGWQEFLGPMPSTPREKRADAERLYGKSDHTLKTIPWSKVPDSIKEQMG